MTECRNLAATPVSTGGGQRDMFSKWLENSWRITALPLVLLFVLPIAGLFARISLDELWLRLGDTKVLQAMLISLRTTLISLACIVVLGTPLAYLLGRHEFRFKKVLDTLIDLPTVLPPSVAGVALLISLGRRSAVGGWLDSLGIEIAFTAAAVVIAQVFIAAPFYVRAATLGFASIDAEIEQAAELDGATRWQIFRYVILPLSRSALISGGIMSWARALGEFGATIIFAGNLPGRTQTMPIAIYLGFETDLQSALALSIILIIVSFLALLGLKVLAVKETPTA